jgi:asparagine synthase (glutamine-hydrolysing)
VAIAGSIRPSEPQTKDEFGRVFALVAASWRRPVPEPFAHGPLRVAQVASFEPPASGGDVRCWVEGRAFNLETLRVRFGFSGADTFPALLAAAQERGILSKVLHDVNGDFFAVVHDARTGVLRLCSDRLGLKPAYYLAQGTRFEFCTRLRGLLAVPGFTPEIVPEAVACYLDLGHLLGDLTWFRGVALLPPAMVLTVDVTTGALARERYWTWGEIPRAPSIQAEDAAHELARLLRAAVDRRVLPGERPSVMLSGGLDSRALLACLPPERCGGTATLGVPGCRDIAYAARVARAAGVSHRELRLSAADWDLDRLHALWKGDANVSPADLSSSRFGREMRALSPVNLNGFAGDLVAGGSYLREGFLDTPADRAFAEIQYGVHAALAPGADDHSRAPHTDPFVLAQRVRRMTIAGTLEAEDASEQRKPFMDNDLLEFLYGLPDGARARSSLYRRALLVLSPALFGDIPCQKTGLPIAAEDSTWGRAAIFAQRVARRLGVLRHFGRPVGFQDIDAWARASAPKYEEMLAERTALWPAFVDASRRDRFDVAARLRAGDAPGAQGLMRAVGLEAWLQQTFNGRLRAPEVPEPDALGIAS